MKLFTKLNQAPKLFSKVSNQGTRMFSKMTHINHTPIQQTGGFITPKHNNLEKSVREIESGNTKSYR